LKKYCALCEILVQEEEPSCPECGWELMPYRSELDEDLGRKRMNTIDYTEALKIGSPRFIPLLDPLLDLDLDFSEESQEDSSEEQPTTQSGGQRTRSLAVSRPVRPNGFVPVNPVRPNQPVPPNRPKTRRVQAVNPPKFKRTVDSIGELADLVDGCIQSLDVYSPAGADAMQLRVQGILGREWLELYQGGLSPTANRKQDVRRDFLQKFAAHLRGNQNTLKWGSSYNSKAIPLSELVGAQNVTLFTSAIDEEMKSAPFRDAVVLHGVDAYAGTARTLSWSKAKHFIVGGSSGAGKTFGAKTIMKALNFCAAYEGMLSSTTRAQLTSPKGIDGNSQKTRNLSEALFVPEHFVNKQSVKGIPNVVSVDGGDTRAVSQIRGITLQAALLLGYHGVSDIYDKTGKMDMKNAIKAAAARAKAHVIEPRTFAAGSENYDKTVTEPTRTVFCMVYTDDDVIETQGTSRAWYDFVDKRNVSLLPLNPNKRDRIGCESKTYSAGPMGLSRLLGRKLSEKVLDDFVQAYKKLTEAYPMCVELINNSKKENGKLNRSRPTHVWVYPAVHKGTYSAGIENPLKFATTQEILNAASMKIEFKDASVDTGKVTVCLMGGNYCVIVPKPAD
jgi:hypothetical protein